MQKNYTAVPGVDGDEADGFGGEVDIELGEGVVGAQESGITEASGAAGEASGAGKALTLEQEVDNWDENAPDDWDGVDDTEGEVTKKRAD